MSVLCEYAIVACFGYFSKVRISRIAILKLFVFLLPISIMFRYLDHLVANKMAPSMCPVEQDGVVGFKQFCTIFPPQIWHLCGLHIFLTCHMPSVLWRCWLGGRKGIRPVKNWVVGYWHGYLSGARCRLAYVPADATATHCLLLQ